MARSSGPVCRYNVTGFAQVTEMRAALCLNGAEFSNSTPVECLINFIGRKRQVGQMSHTRELYEIGFDEYCTYALLLSTYVYNLVFSEVFL